MTLDEKKAWLWRYQESLKREKRLEEEIEVLTSRAEKVTVSLTGMPGGGDGNKIPRAVEALAQAKADLETEILQNVEICREVKAAIEQVRNPGQREILLRRYILGQKFEKIAVEIPLDYRWVKRLHRRAVEEMKIDPRKPPEKVL